MMMAMIYALHFLLLSFFPPMPLSFGVTNMEPDHQTFPGRTYACRSRRSTASAVPLPPPPPPGPPLKECRLHGGACGSFRGCKLERPGARRLGRHP
ncbi:hypothetical protein ASPZODRAFT_1957756 [Penicilliopsis zonata CBS 506.65]|uniref:Secreted protein n=1 Tax=Penicilliopsis zonata CBS 506.65 TaxID=1073090 RepID=A0A1L9SH34_9EURO|nr:hypothetical protein ASPZODRAFT_1957756 [Penicilliopsis zonata CBS 506.65]OJJ46386.1 hypothetical protein ASPZODRAFT_1957756 [Penicilliopsis zonata CBS 506.65]